MPRATRTTAKGRQNASGSAIVWAMIVGGFLLLMVAATLTISYVYHQRSVRNTDDRQAYLTARSGVDLIVNEFTAGSANADTIYQALQTDGNASIPDVGFHEEQMGSCSLELALTEAEPAAGEGEEGKPATIVVTATAAYKGRSRTIIATLVGVQSRKDDPAGGETDSGGGSAGEEEELTWYLSSYRDGGGGAVS